MPAFIPRSRSGRSLLLILLPILVAFVVPAIWLWSRPAALPNANEGQSIAEKFLSDIREGRPEAAWESTTSEFKSAQGQQSFVRKAKSIEFLKGPLDFVSVQTVSINDVPRSEFLFRSKEGKTIRLVLNREGGAWKVDLWNPQA